MIQSPTQSSTVYRSYLVRFWQSHEQGSWRASAQCVQTADTTLFGDVASLFAFLQQEVEHESTLNDKTMEGCVPIHNEKRRKQP